MLGRIALRAFGAVALAGVVIATTASATQSAPEPEWPSQAALDHAVIAANLPDPYAITWEMAHVKGGWWGWTDYDGTGTVTIDPNMPAVEVRDLLLHEWGHIQMFTVYEGDWQASRAEADAVFGADQGEEYAADCIAVLLGATSTTVTDCADLQHRAAAQLLLDGERLFEPVVPPDQSTSPSGGTASTQRG